MKKRCCKAGKTNNNKKLWRRLVALPDDVSLRTFRTMRPLVAAVLVSSNPRAR